MCGTGLAVTSNFIDAPTMVTTLQRAIERGNVNFAKKLLKKVQAVSPELVDAILPVSLPSVLLRACVLLCGTLAATISACLRTVIGVAQVATRLIEEVTAHHRALKGASGTANAA